MTIQIPEQKGYSISSTPQQYRLKKIKRTNVWANPVSNSSVSYSCEYVLQGLFEYHTESGMGYVWRDIETVEETK